MLRWLTAGESHGPELIAVLEGMPAGVPISLDAVQEDLARRKLGYGRGSRMKFEQDELHLSGGVVQGRTIGGPIAIRSSDDPDVSAGSLWDRVRNQSVDEPRPAGRSRAF